MWYCDASTRVPCFCPAANVAFLCAERAGCDFSWSACGMASALLLLLAASAPRRLSVNGSQLFDPEGHVVRPVGFNWVENHLSHVTEDGKLTKAKLPGANAARLVLVLWDNTPQYPNRDCMTDVAPFWKESCFDHIDQAVKSAADAGLWVILTARCEIAAGQNYQTNPGQSVFRNATLLHMFLTMWNHVAKHYSAFDGIAAYEIMSEPRDKDQTGDAVRQFYSLGCDAVQRADPGTPCVVGSRDFYKLWTFDDSVVITNNSNVIYTVDYFVPHDFSFGQNAVAQYPGRYQCETLYPGWVSTCCPEGGKSMVTFNSSWNAHNFQKFALPVRAKYNVPVIVNQWGVVHGVTKAQGRYQFMKDFAELMQSLHIGWTYWNWRGGGGTTWAHGSFEFVFDYDNGTVGFDENAFAAVKPYM
eukprot:TRINITY_DN13281_c0_g1_i1.p1 TRINITY_DN13281_c0_g1~~TRINITY_DN13281_c0_g1_i1.p1  ORF type:complete len:415 (+),score=78.16 TRINITY_DN13281_c0_g1_i1:181-1425(+)